MKPIPLLIFFNAVFCSGSYLVIKICLEDQHPFNLIVGAGVVGFTLFGNYGFWHDIRLKRKKESDAGD